MTDARFVLTTSRAGERAAAPPKSQATAEASGCGCGGGGRASRPLQPIVRVHGEEITPEAIAQETQNHPGPDPQAAWEAAARALVVRRLLLAEARRRGMRPAPESVGEGRYETEDESLIRQILEEAVVPAGPSPSELRRVYEGLQEKFVTPTLFEPAHILIEPAGDDAAAWAQAEAEARALVAEIGDSRQAFAEAATRSACPTGAQGGSLGQIRRGELVGEVQEAIEALADGHTAQAPVRSRFGWHVVRLERRIPGRQLPFEVVEPKIRDMLEARGWTIGAAQFVAELAEAAQIEGVSVTPADAGFGACADGGGC